MQRNSLMERKRANDFDNGDKEHTHIEQMKTSLCLQTSWWTHSNQNKSFMKWKKLAHQLTEVSMFGDKRFGIHENKVKLKKGEQHVRGGREPVQERITLFFAFQFEELPEF